MAVVVIRYETKTTARRALTFFVRIFVNDTIAITVWTSFYHVVRLLPAPGASLVRTNRAISRDPMRDCLFIDIGCLYALINEPPCSLGRFMCSPLDSRL